MQKTKNSEGKMSIPGIAKASPPTFDIQPKEYQYEEITPERLDNYRVINKEYETLLRYKQNLIQKIGILRAVDYTRERVQSGNAPKISEQERYAMALQKINAKIAEYEVWIQPEKEIIKNQISRIRNCENATDYRRILVLRYIEKWKFSEITQELFWLERDFEENGNKYKDKTMRWHREALQKLEKISTQPYVPIAKQLHIQEFHY